METMQFSMQTIIKISNASYSNTNKFLNLLKLCNFLPVYCVITVGFMSVKLYVGYNVARRVIKW